MSNEPTFTLRITKNGTKLATEDTSFRITPAQRDALHAWLAGVGSSPATTTSSIESIVCPNCGKLHAPMAFNAPVQFVCGPTTGCGHVWTINPSTSDGSPAQPHAIALAESREALDAWDEGTVPREGELTYVFMVLRWALAAVSGSPAQPDTQRRLERMAKLISEFAGHLDGCACITSLGPCTCGFEAAWDAIESVAAAARKEEGNHHG